MVRYVRVIPQCLLALVLVLISSQAIEARLDKAEVKVAAEAIDKMAAGAKFEDLPAAMKAKNMDAFLKTTSLEALMHLYQPEKKGGFGVGPKGDGIEARIQAMSKKAPDAAELAKEADDLVKAVQRVKAIIDFNDIYTPKEKIGKKDPKMWKKYNEEVKKTADELIDAIKKGNTKKVQAVSKMMEFSCNECHSLFK